MFVIGENSVELTAIDLMGPVFSSRPYYLVIMDTCATLTETATATNTVTATRQPTHTPIPPTATATSTSTQSPTAIEVPTLSPTPSATVTDTPVPTLVPTATATQAPTATATAFPPVASNGPWCCSWPEVLAAHGITPSMILGFMMGFAAIMGVVWLVLSRPQLTGALEISNQDTGATITVNLSQFGTTVTIGRNGRIQLEDEELSEIAGRIFVQQSDGVTQVFWQSEDEDGVDVSIVAEELTHQSVIQLGRYRLTYQNFSQAATQSESLEGGIWQDV